MKFLFSGGDWARAAKGMFFSCGLSEDCPKLLLQERRAWVSRSGPPSFSRAFV